MEKEGEKGVMAGYAGRQIFPTQLKSESWKMKAEKEKKKKRRRKAKKMQYGFFRRLIISFLNLHF